MRKAILPLLAVLTACSATLPEPLRHVTSPGEVRQAIDNHCQTPGQGSEERCRERMHKEYCEARGGDWFQFLNGCQDYCDFRRAQMAGEQVLCTMDMPMGCDCGAYACWDGLSCVTLPGSN